MGAGHDVHPLQHVLGNPHQAFVSDRENGAEGELAEVRRVRFLGQLVPTGRAQEMRGDVGAHRQAVACQVVSSDPHGSFVEVVDGVPIVERIEFGADGNAGEVLAGVAGDELGRRDVLLGKPVNRQWLDVGPRVALLEKFEEAGAVSDWVSLAEDGKALWDGGISPRNEVVEVGFGFATGVSAGFNERYFVSNL